ncbi:MAG TPA: hypothetical protein VMB52_07120 [Verrucomicrobiae bacterium]|nr:hypothetical protein [Verrucomicrobiae bacterium]
MFPYIFRSMLGIFAKTTPPANPCPSHSILGLVPWYQYLKLTPYTDPDNPNAPVVCQVQQFNSATNSNPAAILGSHSPFLLIGLAIIEDLIRIAALVAVGYTIYGGIQYEISNGAPDKTKAAQQTITNGLVGLVIAILAASIVTFVGDSLGQ